MEGYQPIGKLSPPTLVYTIAAVVITLPSINDDVAAIHKALLEDYPEYSKMEIDVVIQHSTEPLKTREETIVQHSLNNLDRSSGVLLTSERLLFHTTGYEGFGEFSKKFSHVLKVIKEKTGLHHQSGLAFRHVDNIMPLDENKKLGDAIKYKFHTPELSKNVSSSFSRHEYIYSMDGRHLMFRLHHFDQGNAPSIPQDLFPNYCGLKVSPAISVVKRPFILGDFEANNIMPGATLVKFDIENMMVELDELHKLVSVAYREVMTSDELKARGCTNAD